MVEGAPPPTSFGDSDNRSLEVVEHLFRRNAQGLETEILKMTIPTSISRGPLAPAMSFPIDLDRQPGRQAREVERVGTLRTLPSEPEAAWPRLQRPPEQALWRAQQLPELACELHRLDRRLQHARGPSTGLRPVPLPVPGRSEAHPRLRWMSAVRSVVQTSSSRWLSIRCSKVTIPASGRDRESLREMTSVSARSVSPMKTGLGILTLS